MATPPEQQAYQRANSGDAQLGAGIAGFPGQSGHPPSNRGVIVLHAQAVRWGGVSRPRLFWSKLARPSNPVRRALSGRWRSAATGWRGWRCLHRPLRRMTATSRG